MCKECGVEIRGGAASPLYDHVPLCVDCAEKDYEANGGAVGPQYASVDQEEHDEEAAQEQKW